MISWLTAIATWIGIAFMVWYGSLFAYHAIKAFCLCVAFWRWSARGMAQEKRKQEWWRKFYIIVMWIEFLNWRRDCQSLTQSYGTFRWWGDHSIKAPSFKEQTQAPDEPDDDDDNIWEEKRP